MADPPKRELLFKLTRKDFVVEAKHAKGHGGQNVNKRLTACRITHPPSGAVGQAQDQREYKQNEKLAFNRCIETPKFKLWHKMEVSRRIGILKDVDRSVAEEMKKVRVEVKKDGKWVGEPLEGCSSEEV